MKQIFTAVVALLTSIFHLRKSNEIAKLRLFCGIRITSPGRGHLAIADVKQPASLTPVRVHFDHGGSIINGYELPKVVRRVDIKNYRPEFIVSREIKG